MKVNSSDTDQLIPTLVAWWAIFMSWIFAFAAFSKFIDIKSFQESLLTIYAFPPHQLPLVALAVPIFELVISYLLITRRCLGLFLSFTFLAVLTIVVQLALQNGNEVSCGCFGGYSPISGSFFFARNVALILVSYLAFLRCAKSR